MNTPRVIRWVALFSGFVLVSLFALVWVVPRIVDSEAVKSKARVFVAERANGMARIEKIDLFWFPRPGVVIRNVSISFDKEIEASIQQLTLYPSIRHMLTGRLAFSSVTVDGAAWIVRLPARKDEPFNLDELEEKIRQVVKNIGLSFPGMNLRVRRGMADISFGGGSSLRITNIDADLGVTLEKLALTMTAGANVAGRIRLSGELATNSLASEARLSVANLGLRKILDVYSPGVAGWITDGAATLTVKFKAAGVKSVSAEVAGSFPSLILARGARTAPIAAKDFKAIFTVDAKGSRVAIESLDLLSPPLKAAGELVYNQPSSLFSIMLTGRDLDVGSFRKSALLLADDVASVHNVFRYLQDGAIADIRVETRGRSLAEALESKQAVASANMRGVRMFVPGPDLYLANVSGAVLISAGVLECRGCSATLGKAKGRDGTLRVGLAGGGAPFHIDIMVDADARELQTLLVRLVKDEALRKEVSRFHNVDGALSGRLVLGETLDAISAQVSAVQPTLTATYEAVPYPVSLKGGRFNYDNGKIEAEGLEGAIGHSSFSGLTGSVRADRSGQLNIKSASLQLDLQETEVLLRKVDTLQVKLGPDSAARGKISFTSLSLNGPLDDPSRWDFTGRGKVDGILIKHAQLPAAVAITQGTFDASHEKLMFADAKVELLDASLSAGGVVENWRKAPLRLEATVSGVTGDKMMEWVRRRMEIPADYMLRSPLEFRAGRVSWRDDGEFSFNGKLTVAHGPRLSIDMARNFRSLTIKELLIDDAGQSARATFDSDRDKWGLGFSGTLNQQTLDKVFLTAPMPVGLLRGDFAVNVFGKPPYRLTARGTLAGKDIVSSLKGEDAVIEQFVMQGDQAGLNLRSADLRWRRSRVSLSGKLAAAQESLQVDMDIAADRLVWEEFSAIVGSGDRQGNKSKADVQLPTLVGVVRLKTDNFVVGGLSWNPLRVTAGLTANGITGEVEDSVVCGIRTTGSFAAQKNDQIDVDVRLSVQDGDLDSTSRCLSSDNSNVSGTYSLNARLTGSGNRERLAQTLAGDFDFVAREGKFIRSPGIDATFDYLNASGDFKVAFPDLNRETFPYRFIGIKGRIDGKMLIADEVNVDSPQVNLSGQGEVDMERKRIEGKGLVAVLKPVDEVLARIPVISSMLTGSLVGIPIRVAGPIDRPEVTYLSPADVGVELLSIPLRILGMPLGAMRLFTPSGNLQDQNISK